MKKLRVLSSRGCRYVKTTVGTDKDGMLVKVIHQHDKQTFIESIHFFVKQTNVMSLVCSYT